MSELLKRKIQHYWSANVPDLDVGLRRSGKINSNFYIQVDENRFKNEPYLFPLIHSLLIPDRKILEIGCGLGTDLREFARSSSMKCYGVDLAFSNVFLTKNGFELMNLKGEFVNADTENLPFIENSFDIIYSFGVLHHTPDTQRSINEIYRVLKPGGKSVVMLYHKGYAYYFLILFYGWQMFFKGNNKERITSRYDHTPLSKIYSKKDAYKLFSDFKEINTSITTFGAIQLHPILKYVYKILNKNKFLMRHFGSFMIITGLK